MTLFQRTAGVLILLALCIVPAATFAQDNDTITVGGSGIAAPVFDALVIASGVEAAVNVETQGTDAGLAALCTGTLDVALAGRAIDTLEESACAANGVEFVELQLANEALAVIVSSSNNRLDCVTSTNFTTLFAPSARGTSVSWSALEADAPEADVVVILPPANSTAYALLDSQTSGDGIRSDAVRASDYADVIAQVAADENAIGVVNLAAASAAEGVRLLQVSNPVAVTCYDATAENIENGNYQAGLPLFAYVNAASLGKAGLGDVLAFAASDAAAEAVSGAGVSPLSAAAVATLADVVANATTGRTFSRAVVRYEIPPTVAGAINVGGVGHAFGLINNVSTTLQATYNVTTQPFFEGQPASVRRYCNGELDIVAIDSPLTAEELASCEANQITSLEIALGNQAAVLVASADAEYLACVTVEQIASVWRASAEAPATWNLVSEAMPDAPVYLFAPRAGESLSALVIGSGVLREPTEANTDALYRAAATANAGSGMTFMTLADYERAVANGQQGIQLVAVDAGDGCVTPGADTISNGSYALTRGVTLLVNEQSLETEPVKALLWSLFSDSNFTLVNATGFAGLELSDFADARDLLQTKFDEIAARLAEEAAVETPAEATTEATPEPTPASSN
jgi:phosphate transport system substrate-binding protein